MISVTRANAFFHRNIAIQPNSSFNNFLNGSLNDAFFQVSLNMASGNSNYHSGQFRFSQRFATGLYYSGSYTYSHSIDDAADPLVAQTNERSFPRDSSGFAGGLLAEKGNSGFDVRHAFSGNMIYDIPVKFDNKFLNVILAKWTVSGILYANTGRAYTIYGSTDSAGTGVGQRADYIASGNGIPVATGNDARTQTGPTSNFFNNPLPNGGIGRQGSTGRGAFYGPAYTDVDFSLIKRFTFGPDDRFKVKIQADFFNLFNTVNFGQPVNSITSSNFGQSTSTYQSRVIQFGARFDF